MDSEKKRIVYIVLSKFGKSNRNVLEKIARITLDKMKKCSFSNNISEPNIMKENINASIIFMEVMNEMKKDIDLKEFLFMEMGNSAEHLVTEFKAKERVTLPYLIKNPQILQNIFYPENLVKIAHLTLDSKNRIRTQNIIPSVLNVPLSIETFSWNISSINSSYDSSNTAVSTGLLKNIISIKMKPFIMPNLYNNKPVNIELLELNYQSYCDQNKKFHFTFNNSYTTQKTYAEATGYRSAYSEFATSIINKYTQISLTETGENQSIFYFNDPIAELNRLTLKFNDIVFDNDYITATITTGTRTGLKFPYIPHITLYDEIIISNLDADNSDTNAIANILNNINNKVFQITSIISTNTLGTDATYYIDASSVGLTGINNGEFLVYLNSKRFIITLDIEYIPKYIS